MRKIIIFFNLSVFLTGCATLSNRDKTLLSMGGAAVVGSLIGLATTPNDGTSRAMHSLYFGAIGASLAGVSGLYVFDDQKKNDLLKNQIDAQQKQINAIRDDGGNSSPILIHETNAPLGRDIPPVQNFLRPEPSDFHDGIHLIS
jgi:hypothetical protein